MASVLKNFTFPRLASALPWDKWLDGRIWELTEGEDFKVKIATMRLKAFAEAKKKGGKVRTNLRGNAIVIQFFTKTDPKNDA